ncbi:aminopeptidase P N-terminal domain-containing protein, partial [Streptomyces anandii]|uniref:aminopeptidase P N-terminal domain-containing protein n=1 Tax=Streptomyces anandii TaxID=285454 RepID=UPI00357139E2
MKKGWADAERHALTPLPQAAYTARRRAELSARFPGELLVIPAGAPKVRANDTAYPFRPASDYVHLTGDQSPHAVLVMEPGQYGGHRAVLHTLPRSDRADGEFWLDPHGELWDGRRDSL